MALSEDPDKRARQLENLRKGPGAAEARHTLKVVPYADEKPGAGTATGAEPNSVPSLYPDSDGSPIVILVAGIALLAVLVLALNRTGAPHA